VGTERVQILGEKLLINGPEKLSDPDRLLVLADQRVMVWLHQQAWLRAGETLAPWWRAAIQNFSRDHF
jgi:hypothetical protein